jgi:hypothetical protein
LQFPFDFWNISLFFAATSIILVTAVQLVSAYEGEVTLLIDQRKLKTAAVIMGILFLATVPINIYRIMTSS